VTDGKLAGKPQGLAPDLLSYPETTASLADPASCWSSADHAVLPKADVRPCATPASDPYIPRRAADPSRAVTHRLDVQAAPPVSASELAAQKIKAKSGATERS